MGISRALVVGVFVGGRGVGSGRVGIMRKGRTSPGVTFVLSPGSKAGNLSPCFLDLLAVSMSCGENFLLAGRFE